VQTREEAGRETFPLFKNMNAGFKMQELRMQGNNDLLKWKKDVIDRKNL
jgi:hypothetical protein